MSRNTDSPATLWLGLSTQSEYIVITRSRTLAPEFYLTIAILLGGSAWAKDASTVVPADSECRGLGCVRERFQGPPGPPGEQGPRGPAGPQGPTGRVARQDVYAGSVRLGRLISLETTSLCSNFPRLAESDTYADLGAMGLVETSTGYIVHLCIGVRFETGDVGTGLGITTEPGGGSYHLTTNCSDTPLSELLGFQERSFGYVGTAQPEPNFFGGLFGPLMGYPRVLTLPAGIFLPPSSSPTSSVYRVFATTGRILRTKPVASRSTNGVCTPGAQFDAFYPLVELLPNDPAITGLPIAPVTPYTLRDVD